MSVPAFGYAQGVKAKKVWYLSIKCTINSNMLSPRTTYTALLVLRYEEDHIGLDVRPADVRVECGSQRLNGKALLYQNKELMELWTPVQIPIQRKDGWVEIELGDFFTGVGDEEVKMALEDKYTSTPKSGFVIIGIEVRPKKIS